MKKLKTILNKIILLLITISLVFSLEIPKINIVYGAETSDEEIINNLIEFAKSWVGVTPYVLGGESLTSGTDCSGFVMLVYRQFGISLPHLTTSLLNVGQAVSWEEILPGDVIITESARGPHGKHTGIYIGEGKWVHCSSPRSNPQTKISNISPSIMPFEGIRRIIGAVESNGSFSSHWGFQFKPQGIIDQKEVNLDDLVFEFQGNPSKMEYNGEVKPIPWLFSNFSQFIDYILGVMIQGIKSAIVGWTSIIEGLINNVLYSLSFGQ